ncbi:TetR/AcrR family transcriptional regulator [Erythrobacter aurantius]|uniref:TetR/AcrR family transcriptional regulator n=1 Tax=Erythrobacter aurantius TaxID=2909249 RepID=UPI00207987FB|nr:TetR/AcrR family transcriptional regulator [Erythrobacter aurantius]
MISEALSSFWARGFCGVDVDALTRRTRLNRHSLYGAFGGKRGIFHIALESYADTIAAEFLEGLASGTGLDAIMRYFGEASTRLAVDGERANVSNGCFIANTVIEMGRSDDAVNAIIDHYYDRIHRALADAIGRGQGDGSVRTDLDSDQIAQLLIATSQGMSLGARFGRTTPGLLAALQAALAAVPTQAVQAITSREN